VSDDFLNTGDCCEGLEGRAPDAADPPAGLSALPLRVGTHGRFRASMLAAISGRPGLAGLTTRADDDPGIALLDGWATVLDVLSFYQERIANESYLRTATERRSILELARSIGYELGPGMAASVFLAFTLDEAPQAPREATIPPGARVQSVPGQDEKAQTFETVEPLHARAEWNAMRPRLREFRPPGFGDTQVALKGTATNLRPGDAILFVGQERETDRAAENWDVRRVAKAEPVFTGNVDTDYTLVTWVRPLGKLKPYGPVAAKPRVFALRQRASLFGHNAPDWRALPAETQGNFPDGDRKDWPGFDLFDLCTRKGLFGEYFAAADLTGDRQTRLDGAVDISKPDELMPGANSARWTGLVRSSGTRTFAVETDGAVRLWVDGGLVIDAWASRHSNGTASGECDLGGDVPHDIRLEYSRRAHEAKVRLLWARRSGGLETVDSKYLRPPHVFLDAVYPAVQAGGWLVLSQPAYQELYRIEEAVEDSRAQFMLTSKTARVTLSGENLRMFHDQMRGAAVFAESEELIITEQLRTDAVFGSQIELEAGVPELEVGRKVIVTGRRVFAKARERAEVELRPASDVESPAEALPALSDGGAAAWTPMPRSDSIIRVRKGQAIGTTGPALAAGRDQLIWSLVDSGVAVSSAVLPRDVLEFVREDATSCELAEVAESLPPGTDGRTVLVLKERLQNTYDRGTVRVLGNVALATHGESKTEVLGSGDAGQSFQKFALKQGMLTFVSTANAGGADSTLEVRVNDVLWKEVPSFYGLGPQDRCFVTSRADGGSVTVEFGDGVTGQRPRTGQENIRASYRVGLGLAGNLKAGQLSLLLTRPLGVKEVTNPQPSTGGDDAEPRDQARRNAPLRVLTLDRIVSLQDFEDFARAFPGIGKAQATCVWSAIRRVVFLTVAGPNGGTLVETQPPLSNLLLAIEAAREPTQPVQVGVSTPRQFQLSAGVLLEEGYLREKVYAAVTSKLRDAFSFEQRDFGQAVTASEAMGAMQAVEGVRAVDLDALHLVGQAAKRNPRLPADIARWDDGEGCILPAELLTLSPAGIALTEMNA
jgi:hypothetical protein